MPTRIRSKLRNRRKALTTVGMVAGAAVWHKPVIEVIALPAHAVTTDTSGSLRIGQTTQAPGGPTPPPGNNGTTQPPNGGTTQPPGGDPCLCDNPVYYRVKANWNGQAYVWEVSPGNNNQHCDIDGSYTATAANGGSFGTLSGNAIQATFNLTSPGCRIVRANHKASTNCIPASVNSGCAGSATYTKASHDISFVSAVLACCN